MTASKNDQTNLLMEAIRTFLSKERSTTQEQIRQGLARQGIVLTQSKISRLLHKIGVIKRMTNQAEAIYALPWEPLPTLSSSAVGQLVLTVTANESMIVIRTKPGSASVIAHLLDHHQSLPILGTLAGDDTLFVVPRSQGCIQKLVIDIKKVLIEA